MTIVECRMPKEKHSSGVSSDIVDWLSGRKYGFMPHLQNNWTVHVLKERTIWTQMNTD